MTQQEIGQKEANVLIYLKNEQKIISETNLIAVYYGVGAKDIIKFIEHPELCGRWPFETVYLVYEAVKKIAKNYIIPFPKIEAESEEDRMLDKLLAKNHYFAFGTNKFFGEIISVNHIIAYLKRDEVVYLWNAYFVLKVQNEVKRTKEFLLSAAYVLVPKTKLVDNKVNPQSS